MRNFLMLALIAVSLTSTAAASSSSIFWRVEAGFAPFGYASNPDELMKKWGDVSKGSYSIWAAGLASGPGIESPFSKLIGAKLSRAPWLPGTGQYDRAYAHPTHTVIRASLPGELGTCEWMLSGKQVTPPMPCGIEARIADVPLKGATLSARTTLAGEIISEEIVIDHRIILAMGDSYASGEGNPDIATMWKPGSVTPEKLDWISTFIRNDAQWWDDACHRSFWNNQTLVALKVAASDPHRLVTYLQYSCSGAEVLDGMITRQAKPPGIANRCSGRSCYLKSSQLAAAVRDLCVGETVQVDTKGDEIAKHIRNVVTAKNAGLFRVESYDGGKGLDLVRCQGDLTMPDLVLLSIGGNDAGFAQLAAWAIAPDKWSLPMAGRLVKGGVVCPETNRAKRNGCKKPFDRHLANQLERRYALLAYAMREVLPVASRRVVQSTYPDPMLQSDGAPCSDPLGYNPKGPWIGAAYVIPRFALGKKTWHYNITKSEAGTLSGTTLPQMLAAMISGIQTNGFVMVDLHKAFIDHGWCNTPASDPSLALPSFAADSTSWRCGSSPDAAGPSCWVAYAPSRRFIRTINDSLLTQSSSRKDGHTGAIHPNLGGQATMADAIFGAGLEALPWIGIQEPQVE